MAAEVTFNPFDPADVHEMWELTAALRRERPVSRPFPGTVYVARYEDCRQVLRNREDFSNAQGFRAEGVVVPADERMIGEMDAPQHPRIRRLVVGALRPTLVEREEVFTRAYTDQRLSAVAEAGGGDLISLLTTPIANAVLVHLVGAPVDAADQIAAWGNELMHSDYPLYNRSERGEGIGGGFPEFAGYLDGLIAQRRAAAGGGHGGSGGDIEGGDLIAQLVAAGAQDESLSDTMIRTVIANLLLGGVSTTTNLLGNLLYRMLLDPTVWAALAADPSLIPVAVEESLRHTPPIPVVLRTCIRDVQIAGETVRAGERVVLGIASANRDESVFPDAATFRLDRGVQLDAKARASGDARAGGDGGQPESLAFGSGAHLCLGEHLARMQARVVAEAVVQTFEPGQLSLAPDYHFSTGPVYMEYGPATLNAVVSGG